jgi:hypothetical protein
MHLSKGMNVRETQPIDMDALDEVSALFAPVLFAAYPQWRERAAMARNDPDGNWYLSLEVESPASGAPLEIVTENDEVTVFYDAFHSHYGWPPGEQSWDDPFAMIEGILSERYAVASYWNGKDWCGSDLLEGSADPDMDRIPDKATTARICSWRGTHNRQMTWGR